MEITVNPKASEWILKQPWLSQFVDNCIGDGATPAKILSYLLGENSCDTVDEAFLWSCTPEGKNFWDNINDEMLDVSGEENWKDFNTTIEI